MNLFLISKTAHLVFVMAFVASTFYLPRILVNLAESQAKAEGEAARARLILMGRRMYRFGHVMFGMAFIFGLLMWQGYRLLPETLPQAFAMGGWLHAKLGMVALLLAYFIYCGRLLKAHDPKGKSLPSATALRWLNELPLILLVLIVYLVLAKPF